MRAGSFRRPGGVWSVLAMCALGEVWTAVAADAQATGTMLDRPARLEIRNVPLEKALVLLQRASGVALAYSPDLLPDDHRVSCPCKRKTVAQALDHLLKDTDLRYRLGEDNVVIGRWKRSDQGRPSRPAPLPRDRPSRPAPPAPTSR